MLYLSLFTSWKIILMMVSSNYHIHTYELQIFVSSMKHSHIQVHSPESPKELHQWGQQELQLPTAHSEDCP